MKLICKTNQLELKKNQKQIEIIIGLNPNIFEFFSFKLIL